MFWLGIEQQVNTDITAALAATNTFFYWDPKDWDNYILQEAKQFMGKNDTFSY